MLFPLKLNAFERYMLADDQAAYPMSFFVQVVFSGAFDKDAFVAALETALRRHPLLCARLAGRSERELAWVASPSLLPFLDCAGEDAPMRFPSAHWMDLREENGLRVWVRHSAVRGVMRFQFHHACCDGVAANQFVEDVFCAYDMQKKAPETTTRALRPLDAAQLRCRHRFETTLPRRVLHGLSTLWGLLIGAPLFFLRRPLQLCSAPPDGERGVETDERMVPELLTWQSTPAQLDSLLAAARRGHATLNDVMLRDFFIAMRTWNESLGAGLGGILRIMVPFDLRGPEHRQSPAANVMGLVNVDRHVSRLTRETAQLLLEGIRRQTSALKTFRVASAFAGVLEMLSWFPGGLQKTLASNRCLTTIVLSNLKQIFADAPLRRQGGKLLAGNLVIEAVDTAPPIRAGTRIACTFYSYAGRLSLTMNYDRRAFRPAVARQLLDHLVAQIERSIG